MVNVILILIVAIIAFFAIRFTVKRMQGKAGCCGGGGQSCMIVHPKKIKKVVGKKILFIEGMKCKNCALVIQNALNSLENVNAKVNFKKNLAEVKFGLGVNEEILISTIENKGYKVTGSSMT